MAAVAAIFYHAAAGLPILAILTLISGRRGHAVFFLWAGQQHLRLALFLSLACPIFLFCSYAGEIAHYHAPLRQQLAPLFSGPGLPWSTSFAAFLFAFCVLLGSVSFLGSLLAHWQKDRLSLRDLRYGLLLSLLAAAAFLATFILLHWPFAGLPQGLTWEQAALAVFRNGCRSYFMAFCPAGALGLLALFFWQRQLQPDQLALAVRWFAFWACAGMIPHWLVTWGLRLGLGVHSPGAVAQGMAGQDPAIIAITLALFAWLFLLWKPHAWRFLAPIAFALYCARAVLPYVKTFLA